MPIRPVPPGTDRGAVRETARRILAEHPDWPSVWNVLELSGFTDLPIEDLGLACDVIQAAAGFARSPLPLVTSALVAPWLRAAVGLPSRPGPVALAGPRGFTVQAGRLSGSARGVLFAEQADCLLVLADAGASGVVAAQLEPARHPELTVRPVQGRQGTPSGDVVCSGPIDLTPHLVRPVPPDVVLGLELIRAGAVTCQLAGVLAGVGALTIRYAHERVQFGRPIAEFQMVKSHLAELSAEVAAADAAAEAVARAVHAPVAHEVPLRAGRIRTAQAATVAARLAHQVHGTMGFTEEYPLHLLTKQLWFWRDQDGTQRSHEQRLGTVLAQAPHATLWEQLVTDVPAGAVTPGAR